MPGTAFAPASPPKPTGTAPTSSRSCIRPGTAPWPWSGGISGKGRYSAIIPRPSLDSSPPPITLFLSVTKEVLFILGTRPEAIKLAPVILHMAALSGPLRPKVCVTAQHRAMLDQVLACFQIQPDYDLDLMSPGQSLAQVTSRVLTSLDPLLTETRPAVVVVQGDTTTTMAGALAAFYRNIPVAHVEAGLRTGDLAQPFPEELNRVVTGRLAALHFAPT